MSFVFSVGFCKRNKDPVRPLMGPMTFNRLRTLFYAPILSPYPPLLLLPCATSLPSQKVVQARIIGA